MRLRRGWPQLRLVKHCVTSIVLPTGLRSRTPAGNGAGYRSNCRSLMGTHMRVTGTIPDEPSHPTNREITGDTGRHDLGNVNRPTIPIFGSHLRHWRFVL